MFCAFSKHHSFSLMSKASWPGLGQLAFLCDMPREIKKHAMKSKRRQHKTAFDKRRQKLQAYQRQAKRELKTNSNRWRKIRNAWLNDHPFCFQCEKNGVVKIATVLDHKDGDANNNDESNYQSLCASCHSRKTARFDGGFGNDRKK
jgi:5-methylcytosine-specific restriction protein A